MNELQDRVALVTGAGQGMGRAHARELAMYGAAIGVNDRDAGKAQETVDLIEGAGGRAVALPADVSDRDAVDAMVQKLSDQWGRIDILVSNAGTIHSYAGLADTDDDEWHRSFAVHVDGAMFTSRACLPWLLDSPAPRIIIISSIWGQSGIGHSHGYCAAKGALMAFAKNLAKELGPKGISVNSVAPGGVHTFMTSDMTPEDLEKDYESVPLRRYAEPSEISHLVAWLATDRAGFMTGQTLSMNGGQVIGGF